MSDIIDTNSKLFKLYLARRLRKSWAWNVEDVLEMDANQVNICSFVRNVMLEVGYRAMMWGLKIFGILLAIVVVITPIDAGLVWLFTDLPHMPLFGFIGEGIIFVDAVIAAFAIVIGIMYFFTESKISKSARADLMTMTTTNVFAMWVKSVHGNFCVKLKFDRESTNSVEDDQDMSKHDPKWPRE